MRKLTDHAINGLNEHIEISVLDEPGPGGANHVYELSLVAPPAVNPGDVGITTESSVTMIRFQKGPIQEVGVKGVSNEAVLVVLIDRMRGFQSGPFACQDNANALAHLEEGLRCLQARTKERMARGVEGTSWK